MVDAESESSSDQMEIDQAKAEERDEEEMPEPVTPEQSDDETDEESDSTPQPRATRSETLRLGSATADAETEGVPPPRVLPFSKRSMATRSKTATEQPSRAAGNSEDDETDNEEL